MAQLEDTDDPRTIPTGTIETRGGREKPGLGFAEKWMRTAVSGLAKVGSILVLLIAWEAFSRSGLINQWLLPPFTRVIAYLFDEIWNGDYLYNIGLTTYRMLAGYGIAVVIGVPLGILMARRSGVRWFFDPLVSIGFPAPKIAFLPVFILWFGLFDLSKILMIAFNGIFPIVAASWAGANQVDKQLVWSARSLGASEREVLNEIILPAAMPQIMTGLQIALPISMIVALVTEFLMGGNGLGGQMIMAQRFANSPGVFAGIVAIGIFGFVLIRIMEMIRRRLLRWHHEVDA